MAKPARRASVTAPGNADPEARIGKAVDAFRRILRELRIVARRTELATGLSAAQLFVLSAIADSPGCSVNDIAEATMTDRSSAATIVDRLVEQGYVTREQSGEDRRRAAIGLTARGKRAKKDAAPPPTALLIAGLKTLSATKLRELTDGLAALTEGMGIAHEPAGMLFEDSQPARRPRRRAKSAK
ncbi:MAG TPA: MarR family transcriptional regulator [Gemmatimonadaceae bacterium]